MFNISCSIHGIDKGYFQIQSIPFKFLKEEMAQMVTSGTQLTFVKKQPKEEESVSIEELVAKYMKEQENMAAISFEGQYKIFISNLEVSKDRENLR